MSLSDVRWIAIPHSTEARGLLSVVEGDVIPFLIKRIFYMHRVPPGVERGGHAHPHTDQLVIPVAGSMRIDAFDGRESESYLLDDPNKGLMLPRLTWTRLYAFSPDAVILVVCNTEYVTSDVIRRREDFLNVVVAAARRAL